MKLEIEVSLNPHDERMLKSIIEMWKAKWKAEEVKDEDDNADTESEDRDDDTPEYFPETVEEKAHRKALEKLADALRSSGIADVDFVYRRHAVRRNRRG